MKLHITHQVLTHQVLTLILNGPRPASFSLISILFTQSLMTETLIFSGIQTWIVGVEGDHADHYAPSVHIS